MQKLKRLTAVLLILLLFLNTTVFASDFPDAAAPQGSSETIEPADPGDGSGSEFADTDLIDDSNSPDDPDSAGLGVSDTDLTIEPEDAATTTEATGSGITLMAAAAPITTFGGPLQSPAPLAGSTLESMMTVTAQFDSSGTNTHASQTSESPTNIINLMYNYTSGDWHIDAAQFEVRVTFPAGLVAQWPSGSSAVSYSSVTNGDGSTTITVKWNSVEPGSGSAATLLFYAPNGITPDGTQFPISVDTYYGGVKSDANSSALAYTANAPNYGWTNVTRTVSPGGEISLANVLNLPDLSYKYTMANNQLNTSQGLVYTEKITFTDTIVIDENILVTPANITDVAAGFEIKNIVYQTDNTHVKSFDVVYTGVSSDTTQEFAPVFPDVAFKITGATLDDSSLNTTDVTTVTKALSSAALTAAAYPAYTSGASLSDDNGKQYQPLSGNSYGQNVKYTPAEYESPTASQNISKSRALPQGTSSTVSEGDTITYTLYGFKNNQMKAMDSFTVYDKFDGVLSYPTVISTGVYKANGSDITTPANYTINIYQNNSATASQTVTASYGTNQEISLLALFGNDVNQLKAITKIEFVYGAVPAGFAPTSNPKIKVRVLEQTTTPYVAIENVAELEYTYLNTAYKATSGKTSALYDQPDLDADIVSKNKTYENLTNPGATYPGDGDILLYTVEIVNETGRDFIDVHLVDTAEGLKYYSGAVDSSWNFTGQNGFNVRILTPSSGGVVTSLGDTDFPTAALVVNTNVSLAANETIKVSYLMQVDLSAATPDPVTGLHRITNDFAFYGYIAGETPPSRHLIGEGYHYRNSTGESIMPRVSIETTVYHPDNNQPVAADNTLYYGDVATVEIVVANPDYMSNGKPMAVNVGSLLASFSGLADNPFALVGSTVSIKLPNGTTTTAPITDAAGSTSLAATGYNMKANDLGGAATNVELKAGESLTVTFQIEVTRHADVSQTSTYETRGYTAYAMLEEANTLVLQYPNTSSLNDATNNRDLDAATLSGVSATNNIYIRREAKPYAGITTTATPGTLDISTTSRTRTYTLTFYNYSDSATLEIDKLVSQIPVYETYVPGSATVEYKGGGLTSVGVTVTNTFEGNAANADNNTKTLLFTGLPNNPATLAASLAPTGGSQADRDYVTVTFETEIKDGADLAKAIAAGQDYSMSVYALGVYLKNTELVSPNSGSTFTQVTDANDWDGDGDKAEKFYVGSALSLRNYYGNPVVPGIKVETMYATSSGAGGDNYYVAGGDYNFLPGDPVAFRITAINGSSRSIVNPIIVVELPQDMTFEGFRDGAQPAEISGVTQTQIGDKVVLLIETSGLTLNSSNNNYNFIIRAGSANSNYGDWPAKAYLVPKNAGEVFYNAASGGGAMTEENLKTLSGVDRAGFDQLYPMVESGDSVRMYGMFAYSTSIEVSADGKTATGGGYIEVPRTVTNYDYTLTFNNASLDKHYEGLVLVDRLPAVGDVGSVNGLKRGSTVDLRLSAAPIVTVTDKNGATLNLNYTIEYTDAPVDVTMGGGDYGFGGASVATWSSAMNIADATAFRIVFSDTVEPGVKVTVTFPAKVTSEIPYKGPAAYNTFSVGFRSKYSAASDYSEISSETRSVGVVLSEQYVANISGIVFIDFNENGVMDGRDCIFNGSIQVVLEYNGQEIARQWTNSNGYYEFTNLTIPDGYQLAFKVPFAFLVSRLPSADTVANTSSVTHNHYVYSNYRGEAEFVIDQAGTTSDMDVVRNVGLVPEDLSKNGGLDTGDTSNIRLYYLLLIPAAAAILVAVLLKRRKNRA